MTRKFLLIFIFFVFLPACQVVSEEKKEPVATVNGDPIPFESFQTSFELTKQQMPENADTERVKETLLQQLIQDKLLLQEARRRQVEQMPYFRNTMWVFETRELSSALRDSIFAWTPEVRQDEIEERLPKIEKKVYTREIVVEDQALADSLRQEIDLGADFSDLARQFSVTPSAENGGYVGSVRKNEIGYPPAYMETVMNMREGQISDVVSIRDLFAILQADSIYPATDLEARRRGAIRQQLIKERQAKAYQSLRVQLLEQATVKNYPAKLDSVPALPDTVLVAQIDDENISYGLLKRFMGNDPRWTRFEDDAQGAKKALDALLEAVLFRKEAIARGYDQNASYQGKLRVQQEYALKMGLVEMQAGDIRISDADARAYYNENLDQYQARDQVSVRQIVVDTKAAADSIYAWLMDGASFVDLAETQSLDTETAELGGRMGYLDRSDLEPRFAEVAFSLERGEISEPFETDDGFVVIELIDRRQTAAVPFEVAEPRIQALLAQLQRNERMKDLSNELRAAAEIEINEELLSTIQ